MKWASAISEIATLDEALAAVLAQLRARLHGETPSLLFVFWLLWPLR